MRLKTLWLYIGNADGENERQVCEMQGLVEGPNMDDDQGECFSPLIVNATSVNVEVYYNKAVNYTLMVTFVSSPLSIPWPSGAFLKFCSKLETALSHENDGGDYVVDKY